MLSLIPILSATVMPISHHDFKVVSVERNEVFAGKLGRRVEQTIIAEHGGKRFEIKLGRSHTAIRGSTKSYSAGDTVRMDWGTSAREVN